MEIKDKCEKLHMWQTDLSTFFLITIAVARQQRVVSSPHWWHRSTLDRVHLFKQTPGLAIFRERVGAISTTWSFYWTMDMVAEQVICPRGDFLFMILEHFRVPSCMEMIPKCLQSWQNFKCQKGPTLLFLLAGLVFFAKCHIWNTLVFIQTYPKSQEANLSGP